MAKDYSALSKDELISLAERLEDKRKYGLVWDEEQGFKVALAGIQAPLKKF